MVYFLTHKLCLDIRGVKSNRNIIPLESQNFYSVRKQYVIPLEMRLCDSVRKAVNTTRYDLPGNRQGGSRGGLYNVRECLASGLR